MTLREALAKDGDQFLNRKGTEHLELSMHQSATGGQFTGALRHINASTSDQLHRHDIAGADATVEYVNQYAADHEFAADRWEIRHYRADG